MYSSHAILQSRYRGAPLDAALNDYFPTPPSDLVCPAIAREPATVVLTYAGSVRYVELDMAGCPAVVLSTGARGVLRERAVATVLRYWDATVERATP